MLFFRHTHIRRFSTQAMLRFADSADSEKQVQTMAKFVSVKVIPSHFNLHCTWIVIVFDALPHSLLTSHLYSPASFRLAFVSTNKFE